ncbi:hypothetical protein TL16_g09351, partial [Triparma laevis f. inornata]
MRIRTSRRCSTSSSRWGPPALESSKDKFLIQSCPVAKSFYDETKALGAKDVAETLTAHWAKVTSAKEPSYVVNKELPVKHTVDPDSLAAPSSPKAGFGSVAAGKDTVREGMQPSAFTIPPFKGPKSSKPKGSGKPSGTPGKGKVAKPSDSIILEEEIDPNYVPSEEEVL